MVTDKEKQLATQIEKKLDNLLTVVIAGGVGLQFPREEAKLMQELMRKIKQGDIK